MTSAGPAEPAGFFDEHQRATVEHEDPVWGGTEPKIETGLEVARRTLRPLLVA